MSGPLDTARDAWGPALPDWVEVLARECARSSQRQVGERIGRSAGLISQVLRRKYPGDMAAVEDAVRGAWMGARITCPARGPMPTDECQMWRRHAQEFAPVNSQRVAMFRACTACPRNRKEDRK